MGQLLDQIQQQQTWRPGPACGVATLLQHETHGQDLQQALDLYPTITYAAIARALRQFGLEVSQGSLSRHHRGECKCPHPESSS